MRVKFDSIKKRSLILLHGNFTDEALNAFKKSEQYFVLEGRPDLLASKNILKILGLRKIIPTMITDNMAGFLFYKDLVKEVRVSYQYDDETGALCDIGALILGVLAKTHKVPVHLLEGKLRRRFLAPQDALLTFNGKKTASANTRVYGPLVEWLPNEYITQKY